MARIKIEELPVMEDIDAQETKGIFGGGMMIEDKPWSRRGRKRGRFDRALGAVPTNGALGWTPPVDDGKGFTGLE